MKTMILIHTVSGLYHHQKSDRCLVDVEFHGRSIRHLWMSSHQWNGLEKAVSRTPNGYSCKECGIFAVFDDDRFVWASNDAKWLGQSFGVPIETWMLDYVPDNGVPKKLNPPETVEIPDELRD